MMWIYDMTYAMMWIYDMIWIFEYPYVYIIFEHIISSSYLRYYYVYISL